MMKKVFKWFTDKLLDGLILLLIGYVYTYYKELPPEGKKAFWEFPTIKKVLTSPIELWKIILLFAILLVFRWISKKLGAIINDPSNSDPEYLSYTSDVFGVDKTKYGWEYTYDGREHYVSKENIKPFCPTCQAPLKYETSGLMGTAYVCQKCRLDRRQNNYLFQESRTDIQAEITRRITTGEYLKKK